MNTGYRPELIQRAFVDFIGSRLQPFWSLTIPKLRLIARQVLSEDLVALQFETNRAFGSQTIGLQDDWKGGQHLNLSVVIDGVYHQRSYSLVGLPQQLLWWHDDTINNVINKRKKQQQRRTVTIAIKPQGLVSNYLSKRMTLGTIINSSMPSGDFTLENASLAKQVGSSINITSELKRPAPLLFVAGGSGITPMLGLITQALQYGYQVTLLHYNRTSLLQSQWQQLAAAYPTFSYYLINTEDSATYLAGTPHLSKDSLLALDLPLADTKIFACGSQSLLAGLYSAVAKIKLAQNKNLRDNIMIENFGHAVADLNSEQQDDKAAKVKEQTIYLRARQRQFNSSTTLLTAAEDSGIRLSHGYRQGICQLCRCNKVSGVVKNIQTGKVSSDGYESIQTCINVAMTDVVLDI